MRRLPHTVLHRCAVDALTATGLSAVHARCIADALIETSLRGVDTHGIRLLEVYCRELADGRSRVSPNLSFKSSFPAFSVLDADHAPGIVAATHAMRQAMNIAREQGVAAVSVCNSNHYGAAGHYAAMAAREGMIGISCSHSDALVAAFNGIEPMNGTNPLAMAAPGVGEEMFLLDMATSQVSFSRVTRYLLDGRPLEAGWALDRTGRDAINGGEVHALQPLGGYKGQGLGMLVQILSATLGGMPADHTITQTYGEPWNTFRNIGHFFICLNVEAVSETAAFRQRVSDLLAAFRRSRAVNGETVLVPGDLEAAAREDRLVNGIPLTGDDWSFLAPWLEAATA